MSEIAFLINMLIYVVIIFSIFIIFRNSIESNIRMMFRSSKRIRKNILYDYIRKVYISIDDVYDEKEIDKKIFSFFVKTNLIFIVIFLVFFRYMTINNSFELAFLYSAIIAAIGALIPLVLLFRKLLLTQSDSSREATILVTTLLNQYKIYKFNMYAAIDATILNLDDTVIVKRYLMRLAMRIKEYRSEEDLKLILDDFVFTVNTKWIRLLADSMFFSITTNMDVRLSLNGIIKQIKAIDEMENTGKRMNNEGFIMAKYFAPILTVVMVYICINMMDMSLNDILQAQITGGLSFLFAITFLSVLSYLIEYFYTNKKFDF